MLIRGWIQPFTTREMAQFAKRYCKWKWLKIPLAAAGSGARQWLVMQLHLNTLFPLALVMYYLFVQVCRFLVCLLVCALRYNEE